MSTHHPMLLLALLVGAGCASVDDTATPDSADSGPADTADTGTDTADTGTDTADTGTDTADTGTDTADTGTDTLADPDLATLTDWIDTQHAWSGDTTCLGTVWDAPEAVCQVDFSLSGALLDFQTADAASGVDWSLWRADDPRGTPDVSGTSNRSGGYSTTAPSCTPVTVATATSGGSGWLPTFTPHTVWPYANLGVGTDDLSVVSEQMGLLVPALLGVTWDDATTGMISGRVVGCDGDPLGHVQVVVVDAEGHAPAGAGAWYFDGSDLPAPRSKQPAVHEDNGLFVILNVPDGEWRVFVFGWDGAAYVNLGASPLTVSAGTFTILDLHTGHDDGVSYPDICFAQCDAIN